MRSHKLLSRRIQKELVKGWLGSSRSGGLKEVEQEIARAFKQYLEKQGMSEAEAVSAAYLLEGAQPPEEHEEDDFEPEAVQEADRARRLLQEQEAKGLSRKRTADVVDESVKYWLALTMDYARLHIVGGADKSLSWKVDFH